MQKKSRVDKIIGLFRDIEKPEINELIRRMPQEIHVYPIFHIPTSYVEGHEPTGRLLKQE